MAAKKTGNSAALGRARLSAKVWAFAFLTPAVLILVGLLFTLPQSGNAQNERANEQATQAEVDALAQRIDDLRSGQAPSADALLAKSRELDILLPAELRPLDFNNALLSKAQATGLQDVSVAVQENNTDPNNIAFLVSASGPPQQLVTYAESLLSDPTLPLATIKDFSLSVGETTDEQGQANSTAAFQISAWFLPSPVLDEEARSAQLQEDPAAQQNAPTAATTVPEPATDAPAQPVTEPAAE